MREIVLCVGIKPKTGTFAVECSIAELASPLPFFGTRWYIDIDVSGSGNSWSSPKEEAQVRNRKSLGRPQTGQLGGGDTNQTLPHFGLDLGRKGAYGTGILKRKR